MLDADDVRMVLMAEINRQRQSRHLKVGPLPDSFDAGVIAGLETAIEVLTGEKLAALTDEDFNWLVRIKHADESSRVRAADVPLHVRRQLYSRGLVERIIHGTDEPCLRPTWKLP